MLYQLFEDFHHYLRRRNPYVVQMGALMQSEIEEDEEMALRVVTDNSKDQRRYNTPPAIEVAVVLPWNDDEGMQEARHLIIRLRHADGEQLRILKEYDSCSDPMRYPFMFPDGTQGWHWRVKTSPGSDKKVTSQQFYRFYLNAHLRRPRAWDAAEHPGIMAFGPLSQEVIVDQYVKIE